MKKTLLFPIIVLFFIMIYLVSCSKNNQDDKTKDDKNTNEATIATLYDFESGIFNVRMPIYFGKITLNKEKEYVHSGEKSIKICPFNNMNNPYMYLPIESTILGFSYTDISKIYGYKLCVYSEDVSEINVGLYFDNSASSRGPEQKYNLNAGWNEIEYYPQYSILSLQYDIKDCKGLYLMFKSQTKMPTIYLDDVSIILSSVSQNPENLIILKRTESYFEICDFENAYQHLMFKSSSYNATGIPSVISIVKAEEYGITAPSGKKVLRVELIDHTTPSYSWTKVQFVPALIQEINLKQFSGHLDEYVLKFETYRDFELIGSPYENLIEINAYYNGYGAMDWAGTTLVEQGVWETTEIPLTSLANFINNQFRFELSFIERNGDSSRVYYFDNFRIEKESK